MAVTCAFCDRGFRSAVACALRDGRLTRLPCRDCGSIETQAHHFAGYALEYRLDVVWLCKDHHTEAHHPGTLELRERARQILQEDARALRRTARRMERQPTLWEAA